MVCVLFVGGVLDVHGGEHTGCDTRVAAMVAGTCVCRLPSPTVISILVRVVNFFCLRIEKTNFFLPRVNIEKVFRVSICYTRGMIFLWVGGEEVLYFGFHCLRVSRFKNKFILQNILEAGSGYLFLKLNFWTTNN